MPSKKKKYNARFPAGRIKKIMQTDEEVGKVAQAVPVIISKALEMFIESLLQKSMYITKNRNAKTITPSHMKQCILSESRFDFLKELAQNIPDASVQEDNENNALAESNINFGTIPDETSFIDDEPPLVAIREKRKLLATSEEQSSSSPTHRTPVIKFAKPNNLLNYDDDDDDDEPNNKLHITIASQNLKVNDDDDDDTHHAHVNPSSKNNDNNTFLLPPLVPFINNNSTNSSTGENLCIDEDYDN